MNSAARPPQPGRPAGAGLRRAACAVLALGLLAPAGAVLASELKMKVTAQVLKHSSLRVLSQPTSVTIAQADIERGFVEVTVPARVLVQNNSASGYQLLFSGHADFVRAVQVHGLGDAVEMPGDGGFVAQTGGRALGKAVLDMRFRLMLSGSAQQGTYAWPMQLSIAPL